MENKNGSTNQYFRFYMERMKGIEPSRSAWKAEVLPLNYIRISATLCIISFFYFVVKIICVKNPVICFEYSAPSFNILILNYSCTSETASANGCALSDINITDILQSFPPKKGALLPWGSDNF